MNTYTFIKTQSLKVSIYKDNKLLTS